MDCSTTTFLDQTILERNFSALEAVDAPLAARLREAIGSNLGGSEPAQTRDGRISLRLRLPDGSSRWLGRTSIPEVRAQALLDQFEPGTANVLLPGFGQGREAALLLERLGTHRAVFVWESDPVALALPLAIHDFAESLRNGRLILVLCEQEQLEQVFVNWLEAHPGYTPPARIMMWPWMTEGCLAPCQAALERAYHQTENRRSEELRRLSVNWPACGESGSPDSLAIMGLHARPLIWAWADAMENAAKQAGFSVAVADLRLPGDVHPLARLQKVQATLGRCLDWALLLDITRQELQGVLPDTVPAVCWVSQADRVETIVAGMGSRDILAGCNQRLADAAVKAGLNSGRVFVCPLPAIHLNADRHERPIGVAILADIGPLEAEANGFRLYTEIEVWNRLRELLAARIETYRSDEAAAYLREAESQAGLKLESPESRAAVLERVNFCLAPSLMWRSIAQLLVKNNITPHVVGRGWAQVPRVMVCDRSPDLGTLRETCQLARVVLHADLAGEVDLKTMLAAGCGAVLVARVHAEDRAAGGLATILKKGSEYLVFRTFRELLEQVRRLLTDEDLRAGIASAAVARCQAEHSPAERLARLRAAITSLSPSAGTSPNPRSP